jgi:hypothetical protein
VTDKGIEPANSPRHRLHPRMLPWWQATVR